MVLYEIFTGKRAYDAATMAELIRLQESAQITSMSSIAAEIDPAVEKAIRRCLDPDPAKRPATALLGICRASRRRSAGCCPGRR